MCAIFFIPSPRSPKLSLLIKIIGLTLLHPFIASTIPIPLAISTSAPDKSPNPGASHRISYPYSTIPLMSE